MDVKAIESLARIMKENELSLLELSEEGVSLKLERNQGVCYPVPASPEAPVSVVSQFTSAPANVSASAEELEGTLVLSPTVGVFYAAASPDSKPFVEIGDRVKKGDVLCVIEAMKLMNEIPAATDGVIVEICVGNGQVVEYNQPLFRIKS